MRDVIQLKELLEVIWEKHFHDVEQKNEIRIRFGRKSKRRLGSIVLTKDDISLITLTRFFADETVPEYVVYETIAHELIHYTHGFSSKRKKQFKYPHQGGIIEHEMEQRGLMPIYRESKKWMNTFWWKYLDTKGNRPAHPLRKRRISTRIRQLLWNRLFKSTFKI